MIKKILVFVFVIFVALSGEAQKKKKKKKGKKRNKVQLITDRIPETLKHSPEADRRLNLWFRDAKYGAFIHFGAYSSLGGSYKGKGEDHAYAEWILMTSGISAKEYRENVVKKFNPKEFNADEWIKTFKDVGFKYIVITAKHHEGFALYDSKVSDYNIVDYTPFKRDLLKELEMACHKYGLHFGIYYSQAQDWDEPNAPLISDRWSIKSMHPNLAANFKPNFEEYLNRKSLPQVEELMKNYKIDLIWFDTPTGMTPKYAKQFSDIVRKYRPDCVINSRLLVRPRNGKVKQSDLDLFDYCSLRDKEVPNAPVSVSFESPDSVSHSFGYKVHGKVEYHTLKDMISRFVLTVCSGGNYLLNNGPMGNGMLDPKAVELYKGIGDWLKVNGESIYNTQKNPFKKPIWGDISVNKKGDVYYLHVLSWPKSGKVTVKGFRDKVKKVSFLENEAKLKYTLVNQDLVVEVPSHALNQYDTVIKVEAN